ncbi:unnamed protein product [Dimorphilus gyrociliatus]|uniref:CARD domain-containing protein n=1 Tax=Dimorphilus gyrociliatus TaxID=2664684 RepID=A0A7I8V5I1_9ANNE|nr:unnamed protein product [Dimorphilus gyrociliatus]
MDENRLVRNVFETLSEPLTDKLEPQFITPCLISKGVLSIDEQADVLSNSTRRQQAICLISFLSRKDVKAVEALCSCLSRNNDTKLASEIVRVFKNVKEKIQNEEKRNDITDAFQEYQIEELLKTLNEEDLEKKIGDKLYFEMANNMTKSEIQKSLLDSEVLRMVDFEAVETSYPTDVFRQKYKLIDSWFARQPEELNLKDFIETIRKRIPYSDNFKTAISQYVKSTKA